MHANKRTDTHNRGLSAKGLIIHSDFQTWAETAEKGKEEKIQASYTEEQKRERGRSWNTGTPEVEKLFPSSYKNVSMHIMVYAHAT